jgi:DNA-binding NarL/FixJ family response regulator
MSVYLSVEPDVPDKRGRLLVVEDHEQLRASLVRFLEAMDYEVLAAADGCDGLRKAREMRPDLLICDLNMTGLPCLDLLSTLKAELPETKVIVTGTATTCERGYALGACYCLSNPISASELKAALTHCLDHESFPALDAPS